MEDSNGEAASRRQRARRVSSALLDSVSLMHGLQLAHRRSSLARTNAARRKSSAHSVASSGATDESSGADDELSAGERRRSSGMQRSTSGVFPANVSRRRTSVLGTLTRSQRRSTGGTRRRSSVALHGHMLSSLPGSRRHSLLSSGGHSPLAVQPPPPPGSDLAPGLARLAARRGSGLSTSSIAEMLGRRRSSTKLSGVHGSLNTGVGGGGGAGSGARGKPSIFVIQEHGEAGGGSGGAEARLLNHRHSQMQNSGHAGGLRNLQVRLQQPRLRVPELAARAQQSARDSAKSRTMLEMAIHKVVAALSLSDTDGMVSNADESSDDGRLSDAPPAGFMNGKLRKMQRHNRDMKLRPLTNPRFLGDMATKTHFTKNEITRMAERFVDLSMVTGEISMEVFTCILMDHFPALAESVSRTHWLYRTLDEDGNGDLSFQELILGLSVMLRGDMQEKLDLLFKVHDLDRSGTIAIRELIHLVKAHNGQLSQVWKQQYLLPW